MEDQEPPDLDVLIREAEEKNYPDHGVGTGKDQEALNIYNFSDFLFTALTSAHSEKCFVHNIDFKQSCFLKI